MKNFKSLALIVLSRIAILPYLVPADSIQPILPNSDTLKWFDAAHPPKGAQLTIMTGDL